MVMKLNNVMKVITIRKRPSYRRVWQKLGLVVIKRFGEPGFEVWAYQGRDGLGNPQYAWSGSFDSKDTAISICEDAIEAMDRGDDE